MKILVTISSDVETIENAIVANHDDVIKATKFFLLLQNLVENYTYLTLSINDLSYNYFIKRPEITYIHTIRERYPRHLISTPLFKSMKNTRK